MSEKFDRETNYAHVLQVGTPPRGEIVFFPDFTKVTVDATDGALDPADATAIIGGILARDPLGANRADKLPTAAMIIAQLTGVPQVGQSFMFSIVNTADAAEAITVTTNTGLTLVGYMVISQNESGLFCCRVTSATTCSVYRIA